MSKKKEKMEKSSMPYDEILPSLMRSNMLRMILTKHIELNKAADTKANMLLTAASIVIAITISSEINHDTGMIIMLTSSLLAVIFAILVIIPKPYHKSGKGNNLLYFRSFREMSEEEYIICMEKMMVTKKEVYRQYIRDIYQYGAVTLTQKYRLLTIGLLLFLVGLTAGGITILALQNV